MTESLTEAIEAERDFDFGDLITEVGGYIVGGIVGGAAFQLMLADPEPSTLFIAVVALFLGGLVMKMLFNMAPVLGRAVTRWRSSE